MISGQLLLRQQAGRTKRFTFVEIQLEPLKEIARRFDPGREKFTATLFHSLDRGMYGPDPVDDDGMYGNIFRLLHELYHLRHLVTDVDEKDHIRRWIWTAEQALRLSNLQTFSLGWCGPFLRGHIVRCRRPYDYVDQQKRDERAERQWLASQRRFEQAQLMGLQQEIARPRRALDFGMPSGTIYSHG
jgi:hypothetical protein